MIFLLVLCMSMTVIAQVKLTPIAGYNTIIKLDNLNSFYGIQVDNSENLRLFTYLV